MADVQLTFYIYLTDLDRVRELQAQYPNGVIRGPQPAAVEFEAPYQTRDEAFEAPSTRTAWHPRESSGKFMYDRAVFRISGGGFFGWLGIGNTRFIWVGQFVYSPPAETPPLEESDEPGAGPSEIVVIPSRRWCDGFELKSPAGSQTGGEGGQGVGRCIRAASRTVDGYGLAIHSAAASITHLLTEAGGSASLTSWERFYFRLRRVSTAAVEFWRCTSTGGTGSEGYRLKMLPSRQIAIYSVNNAGTETLEATTAEVDLETVYKCDLMIEYQSLEMDVPPSGPVEQVCDLRVFLNKTQVAYVRAVVRASFATPILHVGSNIGNTGAGHALEMDFDDWVSMEMPQRFKAATTAWPYNADGDTGSPYTHDVNDMVSHNGKYYRCTQSHTAGAVEPPDADYWIQSLGPVDFFSGSHIIVGEPLSFADAHDAVAWPGDIRTLLRGPMDGVSGLGELTSTTSGGVLEVNLNTTKLGQGVAAMHVSVHGSRAGSGLVNSIGAGIAGEAPVAQLPLDATSGTSAVQNSSRIWASTINQPGSITQPRSVHQLTVRFIKGADTESSTVQALCAAVEFIGVFDECDIAVDPTADDQTLPEAPPLRNGVHNAPYPFSPWASLTSSPPMGGVMVKSGTYIGNDTGQDISFDVPIHFLWIRPVTSPNGGAKWWSSMLGPAHKVNELSPYLASMACVREDATYASAGGDGDPEERYLVRIPGNDSQINANTVVYQYIAFSDPAARTILCGALAHGAHALDAAVVHTLVDADFTPEFGLLWSELHVNPRQTTAGLWVKGPQHAADEASLADAAETASAVTFGTGTITTRTGQHSASAQQLAYALFRSGEASSPGAAQIAIQVKGYTGNGSSPRAIALPLVSNRRPLFAIVVPANAAAWFRDPGHTTGLSSTFAVGAPAANGITAGGVDSVTVGSSLNSSGVDYSMFVIMGGTTAGTDGWSEDGEFILKDPEMPVGTQFDPPPFGDTDDLDDDEVEGLDDPDDGAESGDDLDNSSSLPGTDLFCADFSQKVCNIALSKIGVSKQIEDINTDDTKEAAVARLHLTTDVNAVLSRFPWEFARKYATLTLVDGETSDPVNADWTYAYRRPTDCVFERRITSSRGNAVNPTSPAFALGRNSGGGLIFTNEPDAVLEYTSRGLCPAYEGDDVFKEALSWKLAASFAPSLSRIEGKVSSCLEQYEATIAKAYEVIRPGNPGPTAEADPDAYDQTAAQTAANLAVINRALIRIGARTIPAITADSREALSVRAIFEDELRSVLREYAWAFATRYEELALVAGAATWDDPLVQTWSATRTYEENDAVVSGSTVYYALRQTINDTPASSPNDWTEDEPDEANADWLRAFRLPDDCVFARRLVKPGVRRQYDAEPSPFKLGNDDGGDVLFTDVEQAMLEFTKRLDGIVAKSDALFKDALAWRLAASLAPALAQIDPEETEQAGRGPDAVALAGKAQNAKANKAAHRERVARWAMAMYVAVLEQARVAIANERQDEPDGDAPWIAGR